MSLLNLLVEILHQIAFQIIMRRLKAYLKLSNSFLPVQPDRDFDITIDITKTGSSCLCLSADQIDRIVVISKGFDIFFSLLLASKEKLCNIESIPRAALSLFYASVIHEADCKSLATFWQQPSGDVTMMCTRHLNLLRVIFDGNYLQDLLESTQEEVDRILVPLIKVKTDMLLDANAIYEEMNDSFDDEDEDDETDQDDKTSDLDQNEDDGHKTRSPKRKPR